VDIHMSSPGPDCKCHQGYYYTCVPSAKPASALMNVDPIFVQVIEYPSVSSLRSCPTLTLKCSVSEGLQSLADPTAVSVRLHAL